MQVKRVIESRFPDAEVVGAVYPPTPMKALIAQICQMVFLGSLFIFFAGETIGNALNIQAVTNLARKMKDNQMQTIMMIFIMNFIGGQMLQTGAFEVFHGDDLIFSKLESGTLPQMDKLVRLLDGALSYG